MLFFNCFLSGRLHSFRSFRSHFAFYLPLCSKLFRRFSVSASRDQLTDLESGRVGVRRTEARDRLDPMLAPTLELDKVVVTRGSPRRTLSTRLTPLGCHVAEVVPHLIVQSHKSLRTVLGLPEPGREETRNNARGLIGDGYKSTRSETADSL
ncbi:hypothetical protein FGIG_03947 [Fasciola gigantica]|uniref:Uncharacterized protein n=1 Tax=Fasciola gigantica TaxID=46835 RepID=A0A504YLM0_FASGI|nr:hypothetical protein FGIG_03947 [Fasciola gigantica]